MKIKLTRRTKGWEADFVELSGSPSVGTGKTQAEAISCLFYRFHHETHSNLPEDFWQVIFINDKPWRDCNNSRR